MSTPLVILPDVRQRDWAIVPGMGYRSAYTGHLTIDPPVNRRELTYLRRLHRSAQGRIRRPGYHLPWYVEDDSRTLTILEIGGTKEPVAEWTSYLATHLLGPRGDERFGRALSGFTYDHQIEGDVDVDGRSNGERWTLVAGGEGIWVRREHLPCPSCWAATLYDARPSLAYRFQHPVREANLIDGRYPQFDSDGLEAECLSRTWTPVGRTARQVTWPWSPDLWSAWWVDLEATPDAQPFRGNSLGLPDDDEDVYPDYLDDPRPWDDTGVA